MTTSNEHNNAPTVLQGWKLVPIEPTREMLMAALDVENASYDNHQHVLTEQWKDMLAAAPVQHGYCTWLPIESVPKNGTQIILRKGDRIGAAMWVIWPATPEHEYGEGWTVGHDGNTWDGPNAPTHWTPLPHAGIAATPAPAPAPAQGEPFGYFRAEPFGWTDCSEDAEGAIALYEHPAKPAQEVASAFTTALDIRLAQGWNLTGNVIPVLYTDTINDYQVRRDDVWLCTTDALKTEQEVGLTDEWISVSDRLPDVEPGAPAIEFYNEDLRKPTRQVIGIYRYGEWLSGGHQFSNVTYWKPLTPAPIAALRAKGGK